MKYKIKKNRLKIFIALSLMITCLFGVMFATNTFAYQTDTFSYTIDNLELNSSYNSWTYESETHTFYSPYNTNGYFSFYAYLKTNNNTTGKKAFLMNYNIYRSNDNTNWVLWQQQNANAVVSVYNTNTNTNNLICRGQTKQNTYNYNNMYTIYASPYSNNNNSIETYNNKNRVLVYGEYYANGITNQYLKIEIVNIDFVSVEDVSLNQYYDTYISNIEENYNQLLEDYEDLETDYSQLNNDYTQLEIDYNDLEDNYDNLENQYNELDNKFKNLYFNTNYGIWNFLAYEEIAIFNPSYSASDEYYRYEGITNWVKYNNIIEQNKLNITNAITRYWTPPLTPPYTINCDSWYINMNFSVPNNVSYIYYEMPIDVLDLYIDTNISFNEPIQDENVNDYLTIDIRLSNYENYSYGNFIDLNISRNFLNQYGFKITKENLQEYFSQYDLNYYNNIMSITIESNYKLNTNDKFNIISTNAIVDRNYQLGFIDGQASMDNTIKGLEMKISDLNGTIYQMNREINILNGQIDTLTNDDYNLNNLMWTIGSVPFESFKQIWNVNFFGVNLADFFLGFVTFFIALFVVKKFFL